MCQKRKRSERQLLDFWLGLPYTKMEKPAGQANLEGTIRTLCVSDIKEDIWSEQFHSEPGDQGRGLSWRLISRQLSEQRVYLKPCSQIQSSRMQRRQGGEEVQGQPWSTSILRNQEDKEEPAKEIENEQTEKKTWGNPKTK